MIGQKSLFHGGIVPRDAKDRTLGLPSRNAALPSTATVVLRQHAGAPARPLFKEGDIVHEGQCIAAAVDDGAAVHSPIPGVVGGFATVAMPGGSLEQAMVVNLLGSFERSGRAQESHPWEQLAPRELLAVAAEMGVVGLGADARPLQAILAGKIDQIIVNCMESEPFMTADYRVLVERTDAVAEGVRMLQRIADSPAVTVALSGDYAAALPALKAALAGNPARVQVLPARYPQEDDLLLARSLTGKRLQSVERLAEAGVAVVNVATVHALREAVALRKPMLERIVTVAGGAVAQPANIKVRIGTPISWILEECGGLASMPDRIVVGGPLTGHTIVDVDTPVTKQTRMVLALSADEIAYGATQPCIRCGNCVRLCPVSLEPVRLARLIRFGRVADAVAEGLADCTECCACSYDCPSRVPLVRILREGKRAAAGEGLLG